MGYINNSRHLARKYARIFVRGHYLFREANSFPRAKLEKNCELRGTDNVQGQISEHIFAPNAGYCLYYPSNLFSNACSFENWGIFSDIPQFSLGNIRSRDALRPIARERKDLMDYNLGYSPVFPVYTNLGYSPAHSFPRASLSENCSLLGTDNVRGQISVHIFAPNGDYCLFIIYQIFSLARDWSKRVT